MKTYRMLYKQLNTYSSLNEQEITPFAINEAKRLLKALEILHIEAPNIFFMEYGAIILTFAEKYGEYRGIQVEIHDFFCVLTYQDEDMLVSKRMVIGQILEFFHFTKNTSS